MDLTRWIWFGAQGELNTLLVKSSLERISLKMGDHSYDLKLFSSVLRTPCMQFPSAFALEKRYEKEALLPKVGLSLKENSWEISFVLVERDCVYEKEEPAKQFDGRSTLLYGEFLAEIGMLIDALNLEFTCAFAGEKTGEFSIIFLHRRFDNFYEFVAKMVLLRAGLEECSYCRGLTARKILVGGPLSRFVSVDEHFATVLKTFIQPS